MNRLQVVWVSLLLWAFSAFAQDGSLKFLGLDAGFITFGKMSGTFRAFEVRVDHDPFHFVAKGLVNAGAQTSDLDILGEELGVAVSYFDEPVVDTKGADLQASINELLIIVDDAPAQVKDVTVELIGVGLTDEGRSMLASVPQKRTDYNNQGTAGYRAQREDAMITAALADPWNKQALAKAEKARIAAVEKAKADSLSLLRKEAQAEADRKALQQREAQAEADRVAAQQRAQAKKKPSAEEDPTGPGVPLRPSGKKGAIQASVQDEPADASNVKAGVPTTQDGFMGNKGNRTKLGYGLAAAGGILAMYGIMQHGSFNGKLSEVQDLERQRAANPFLWNAAWEGMLQDRMNEKSGFESRRNIALLLSALSIGGSIVMFRF